jgi:hypothetical protein
VGLFKRKDELANFQHRRSMLAAQLADADRRVVEAEAQRQAQLIDGDLDNGQAAKNPVIISRLRDERDATKLAVETLDARIAEAEQRQRDDVGKVARGKGVELRRGQVATVRKRGADVALAVEELIAVLQEISVVARSAGPMAASAKFLGDQIRLGVETAVVEVGSYIAMMNAGTLPIAGHPPVVISSLKPAGPPVERMKVMVHQHSRWRENGETRTAPKHGICSPPKTIALAAIANGLAIPEDSDKYRRLREVDVGEGYGACWAHVPAIDCTDRESGEAPKPLVEQTVSNEYIGPALVGTASVAAREWR